MKNIFLILILGLFIVSCDNFLDEPPSKSKAIELETAEQLDRLFNNAKYSWSSNPSILATDNYDIPLYVYDEKPSTFYFNQIQHFLLTDNIDNAWDQLWNGRYASIWDANLAIKVIGENSITGDADLKAKLLADAHFYRAMHYFDLAVDYCLYPSSANSNEPGLPLRTRTDFDEDLTRASLGKTIDFIESELEEGLKSTEPFAIDYRYRPNTAAINAFAARFYLYVGDYTKAEQHANAALTEYSDLIDYAATFTLVNKYLVNGEPLQVPMCHGTMSASSSTWLDFWKGQYMSQVIQNDFGRFVPSQELQDLYDPTDVRFDIFVVENYMGRYTPMANPIAGYTVGNYGSAVPSGPSTAEMFLIRAECKARSGNLAGAMADVEQLRVNRFAPADYSALAVPANKKSTIQTVIDERRREMPFSIRFYDIKRINADAETDNVTLSRTFYPLVDGSVDMSAAPIQYTIEPNSRLYARPINEGVITKSDNQTKQNEY